MMDLKITTHILMFDFLFLKYHVVYEITWKNVLRVGQATNDNMAHAHCTVGNSGHKDTLRICNTYCFSTATVVARPSLNVTLYVHCLAYCYHLVAISAEDVSVKLFSVMRHRSDIHTVPVT